MGEKLTIDVTVEKVIPFDGDYGLVGIHLLDADDDKLVWFASGTNWLDEGSAYRIKGIVKEPAERRGVQQTILTRVGTCA